MKFLVKLFPEITIKSKPVRQQFTRQLHANLDRMLKRLDRSLKVQHGWDKLTVLVPEALSERRQAVVDVLTQTPGIANVIEVAEYPLVDLDDIVEKTVALWAPRLAGKTFVVRCRRVGTHPFSSTDVERMVGGALLARSEARGVDLHRPDETVRLEVRGEQVFIVKDRLEGLGGYPLGGLDPVLSLISGGFDSTVASYLTMKRGMLTHFCFFNLGGRAHELGVKQVVAHLWERYGSSHRARFISVPFDGVVGEILRQIPASLMGVVLKRMMLRAATRVAERARCAALVTGEAVAQVSSQTLANLSVISRATDTLLLRPLIAMDKGDIIDIARRIGTEDFAAGMPEYCGVISVRPTTHARLAQVEEAEAQFDMAVLEQALADASVRWVDQIIHDPREGEDVEVLAAPLADGVILDIRHPDEQEHAPLAVPGIRVEAIPFYELNRRFAELDQNRQYLLYCARGAMSRLHAAHLLGEGFRNVKVYRPRR